MWENDCRRLSTLSGDAYGIHATELERRVRGTLFPFALLRLNLNGLGGGGEKGVRRLVIAGAEVWACMRRGREGGRRRYVISRILFLIFPVGVVGSGVFEGLLSFAVARLVCMPAGR